MIETYKDIKNYEGKYQVSNLGQIMSLNYRNTGKHKLMSPVEDKDGYFRVCLYKDEKRKSFHIHRLVAEHFLPNPDNLPQVNHRDENKQNNSVDNLEWCSNEYNVNYGKRNQKCAKALSKTVLQFSKSGEFIREWESINECRRNGFNQGNICKCCNGKLKSSFGYIWRYKEDYS